MWTMRSILIIFISIPLLSLGQLPYLVEDDAKYTFSMITEDLIAFEKATPNYSKLDTIGLSEFGLPLLCLSISDTNYPNAFPVFFCGNIHAREDYSSKLVMKFTNLFLQSLGDSVGYYPFAKSVLEKYKLYIIPVANPDGLKIAHEDWLGIEQFKDSIFALKCVDGFGNWKANGKGTDLNNNFDDGYHLYKKSAIAQEFPASEGYKGCFPADAAEVVALQKFVQKTRPILTLSFHTKGDVLFWRDCDTYEKYNNVDSLINSRVARETGLKLADISYNPISYASGLENYVRSRLGKLAVCVELSPVGKKKDQHPDNQFNKLVWEKCHHLPFIYLDELWKLRDKWPQSLYE